MALFSRRVLQRVLHENAAFLPSKELSNICNLLNTVRDDYLATEWEQVILNAASKVGSIRYEPTLGSRRKPDLLLRSKSSFEFIADITTASDKGLNRLNPVDALHEEFERHLRKRKLLNGGFDVRIDSHSRTIYRGSNNTVALMLPKRSEFKAKIFNAEFHKFMDSVFTMPDQCRAHHARDVGTSVHFSYDPKNVVATQDSTCLSQSQTGLTETRFTTR
jgi:superfamily I DNA/RNA helicase